MVRLVILILVATAAVVAVQHWRGPKLLRVPFLWRSMAKRHPDLADALRIRTGIGKLMLSESIPRSEAILGEVDRVLESLVLLAKTREARGTNSAPDATSKAAIAELDNLYNQLKAQASDRTEDALDLVRERLATTTTELKESTQVRSEIGE